MVEKFSLAKTVIGEIDRAQAGREPQISADQWLKFFQLDGDKQDGLALLDRFVEGKGIFGKARFLLKDSKPLINKMETLVERLMRGDATPPEEDLAKSFAEVATRQIEREGDVCPTANFLATMTYLARPDLFPENIQKNMQGRVNDLLLDLVNDEVPVILVELRTFNTDD